MVDFTKAKYIAIITKGTLYETSSLYSKNQNCYLDVDYMMKRGVRAFIDLKDIKETLNWNLNGDSSKFYMFYNKKKKCYECYVYD